MFCDCVNNPDETEPNVNVCPICLSHPGTLPTLNKEAIKLVLKIGHAVGGQIADYTEWDRKNYFYPDIPKGYQISQYKYPLVSGGNLNGIALTRVHLEEDTGTSIHDRGDYSLLNYNRAGVPLMELVTEPVIHTAKDAVSFAKELQLLLRYLGASEANMEKGEMRVEANISVAEEGTKQDGDVKKSHSAKKLGTKVEVKNLNSFKAVEGAIEYEIKRMSDLLEEGRGGEIVQETRGWDEDHQKTFSQRLKETSDDYRYFPEPDLPKLKISEVPEFSAKKLISELPELPWQKRERLLGLNLGKDQAEVFIANQKLSKIFDQITDRLKDEKEIKLAANYITTDLISLLRLDDADPTNDLDLKITPDQVIELIGLISKGEISSRGAKDILAILVKEGGSPKKIASTKNLLQKSNAGELESVAQKILEENPQVVAEYKKGKESSLQFLIGQGMKATKGTANPQLLSEIFKKLI